MHTNIYIHITRTRHYHHSHHQCCHTYYLVVISLHPMEAEDAAPTQRRLRGGSWRRAREPRPGAGAAAPPCFGRLGCTLCVLSFCTQHEIVYTSRFVCVSSLRRGHANLLCIVQNLTDDPQRGSMRAQLLLRTAWNSHRSRRPQACPDSRHPHCLERGKSAPTPTNEGFAKRYC